MNKIRAKLLGRVEYYFDDEQITNFDTKKNRFLFAYLLMEKEKPVGRNYLASLFWPDASEGAALHNLRQSLSALRRQCSPYLGGRELFVCDGDEDLQINNELVDSVDALEMYAGLSELLQIDRARKGRGFPIKRLNRLLLANTGDFLEGCTLADSIEFDAWLTERREAINHLIIEGASISANYFEQRMDWDQVVRMTELLIKKAPWDEEAHIKLINAFALTGSFSAARSHAESIIRYLRTEMGVEPSSILQQLNADLRNNFPHVPSTQKGESTVGGSLPRYQAPFFGREEEIDLLEKWLSQPDCQFISIVGPGGCGKTRLAAEIANSQYPLFVDGVFFVPIGARNEREEIINTLAESILPDVDHKEEGMGALRDWIHHRKALIILDDVNDAEVCLEIINDLASHSPETIFVFTSYSRQNLIGEKVLLLSGLKTLNSEQSSSVSDAAELFLSHLPYLCNGERAEKEELELIEKICIQVEGFPLSINLAASQAMSMSLERLLSEMSRNLSILQSQALNLPERHRSISAALMIGWQRLSRDEKKALCNLAIFKNEFSEEDAFGTNFSTPNNLDQLVGKSFLFRTSPGYCRFHRLVRLFVQEQDVASAREVQERKSVYTEWIYRRLSVGLVGLSMERMLKELKYISLMLPDILEASKYFIENASEEKVIAILQIIFDYFEYRGLFIEGIDYFNQTLEAITIRGGMEKAKQVGMARKAILQIHTNDSKNVEGNLKACLDFAQKDQDLAEVAFCYAALSSFAAVFTTKSIAKSYALESLSFARRIDNLDLIAKALYHSGYAEIDLGELDQARTHLEESMEICDKKANWKCLLLVNNLMADIACYQGDFTKAQEFYRSSLQITREMGNKFREALTENNLGVTFMETKSYQKAQQAFNASIELCSQIHDHEGESVALSNLGEVAILQADFQKGTELNLLALKKALEIESQWAEISARLNLIRSQFELGKKKESLENLIVSLEKSYELGDYAFMIRSLITGSDIMITLSQFEKISQVVNMVLNFEGAEQTAKELAQGVLSKLPQEFQNREESFSMSEAKDWMITQTKQLLRSDSIQISS